MLRLGSGGSVTELSVTGSCRDGTVMGTAFHACPSTSGQYRSPFEIVNAGTGEGLPKPLANSRPVVAGDQGTGLRSRVSF
jgi:hypothetical protein